MDTSIADFARFAAGFMRGEGLKPASRAEMLQGAAADHVALAIPESWRPKLPPAERWKGLAAGLGVVTFNGPQGRGLLQGRA